MSAWSNSAVCTQKDGWKTHQKSVGKIPVPIPKAWPNAHGVKSNSHGMANLLVQTWLWTPWIIPELFMSPLPHFCCHTGHKFMLRPGVHFCGISAGKVQILYPYWLTACQHGLSITVVFSISKVKYLVFSLGTSLLVNHIVPIAIFKYSAPLLYWFLDLNDFTLTEANQISNSPS